MRGSQKNINYEIKWRPEFAYAIGLLTTDGNLSKDGRHLEFTSKDVQLVKTFKKCMNLEESKKLFPKIYYSTKIPFLNRKYLKIKRAEVEELEDLHP